MRTCIRALAIALVVVTTVNGSVGAHVWTGHTKLSIHVKDASVSGSLLGAPVCRSGQLVTLRVDGQPVATDTTSADGSYSFAYTHGTQAKIQTRYAGMKFGTHPHRHTCLPSASRLVVIGGVLGAGGTGGSVVDADTASTGSNIWLLATLALGGVLLGALLLLIAARLKHRERLI